MTLVEFLRARMAEDAAEAVMATDYRANGIRLATTYETEGIITISAGVRLEPRPGRAVAEVAAKRRIIDAAEEATSLDAMVDTDRRVRPRDLTAEPYVGDVILRALALPYADHPDYREEWRP